MAEIHVVCAKNRHLYEDVMDDYFHARHQIYIDERKWTELAKPDGREIDQFDGPTTVYIIALEGRRAVGSQRMVPTCGPTLMGDVFPQLAAGRGLIRHPDAFELSRMFVVRDRRGDAAKPGIESLVMAGTMEYGLAEGIRQFTIVMETWWISRFLNMGWKVRPLGLPVDIAGMNCVGVVLDVTMNAWRETLRSRAVEGEVLVWNGLEPPHATSKVA